MIFKWDIDLDSETYWFINEVFPTLAKKERKKTKDQNLIQWTNKITSNSKKKNRNQNFNSGKTIEIEEMRKWPAISENNNLEKNSPARRHWRKLLGIELIWFFFSAKKVSLFLFLVFGWFFVWFSRNYRKGIFAK